MCVGVCVPLVVLLSGSVSGAISSPLNTAPFTGSILFCLAYHLSCVLTDSFIFTALVTEKEDQPTAVGFEILDLTSQINLYQKCLLLL